MKCSCSQKKAKTKNKKIKKKSKTQLEKNLSFHDALDHFVFLYFTNACQLAFALHNER